MTFTQKVELLKKAAALVQDLASEYDDERGDFLLNVANEIMSLDPDHITQ